MLSTTNFLVWVITGIELLCVYVIKWERLQRVSSGAQISLGKYRLWIDEKKRFDKADADWSQTISKHYAQLIAQAPPEVAARLCEYETQIAEEWERFNETERLDAQSMEFPGGKLRNSHYPSAIALQEARRKYASVHCGAIEPLPPKPPESPTSAKVEFWGVVIAWIFMLAALWHYGIIKPHIAVPAIGSAVPWWAYPIGIIVDIGMTLVGCAILFASAVVFTWTIKMLIRACLIAATAMAQWSTNRKILHRVFVAAFIVSFSIETYDNAPRLWNSARETFKAWI